MSDVAAETVIGAQFAVVNTLWSATAVFTGRGGMAMLAFITKYLGWRNWSVLVYNSIIENIFIVFYIALRREIVAFEFLTDLLFFVCFSIFSTTYGYLVNDLADMELDALHGKTNTFMGDSKRKATAIVVLFALVSVAFGLRFVHGPYFVELWLAWAVGATFYSLKPFRLKERGKVGLGVAVLAQRVLPILLLFAAFRYGSWWEIPVFAGYVLFRGLSSDLNHQIEDYRNDASTQTRTYAVDAGLSTAERAYRFSLEVEKVLLVVSLLIMCVRTSGVMVVGVPVLILPLAAATILVAAAWYRMATEGAWVNPFEAGRKDLFQFLHHGFPSVVLPFFLLIPLVVRHWQFLVVGVVLAIYRRLYSATMILNSFPFVMIRRLRARLP